MKYEYNWDMRSIFNDLAYMLAENEKTKELEKAGRISHLDAERELKNCESSILSSFAALDGLKVPFWVQNAVIAYIGADWRNWYRRDLSTWLSERNITYKSVYGAT